MGCAPSRVDPTAQFKLMRLAQSKGLFLSSEHMACSAIRDSPNVPPEELLEQLEHSLRPRAVPVTRDRRRLRRLRATPPSPPLAPQPVAPPPTFPPACVWSVCTVEYLNLADTNSNLKGFRGGFATDAHAYYVPYSNGAFHGYAARVSLSDFSSSGVEYLNLAETNPNLKGFIGGFATDAHAYYVPWDYGARSGYAACVLLSI